MSEREPHWADTRWGDPQTRASVDAPTVFDPWTPPPPPPTANPHRLTPVLAGLIGLVAGAALGVPVGIAHRAPSPPTPDAFVPAPQATLPSSGDIAAKADRSIVDITSRLGFQNATAAGTGMVLTANGDILTNNHVIVDATSITVTAVTTGARYRATVVGTDPTQDVAVIHVTPTSPLTPIDVGDSSKVGVGDPVVALGNAGGLGGTPAVATGYVTALDQSITARDGNGTNPQRLVGLIETDAPIRPGDSGGPLVNTKAQVIGMDTAASLSGGLGATTNRGFAIPIARALSIAHQIQAGQGSATVHIGPRGMIGVQISAVSTGGGAVVDGVTGGSPADRAGIRPGDTITSVDGESVTADNLGKLIKAHAAGDRVTVTWTTADGRHMSARVTLQAGPPD